MKRFTQYAQLDVYSKNDWDAHTDGWECLTNYKMQGAIS